MVKVQCKVCGNIGYTSSPNYVRCECGGSFKVIPEDSHNEKVGLNKKTARLFDLSDVIG